MDGVPTFAGSCQEPVGVKGSRLAGCGGIGWRQDEAGGDVSVPTDRDLIARQPDIIMFLKEHNQIVISEVAVAWESLLKNEKRRNPTSTGN